MNEHQRETDPQDFEGDFDSISFDVRLSRFTKDLFNKEYSELTPRQRRISYNQWRQENQNL